MIYEYSQLSLSAYSLSAHTMYFFSKCMLLLGPKSYKIPLSKCTPYSIANFHYGPKGCT